ncbi:hypothetical protein CE91St62_09680 [Lachnospiraceae bacterium]|uniref:hypothetical protein n=1 Tax=Extibacter sp. GGCC_0201 TaxID=2731209 RepID=UPI001AA17708|nr:hypothetical protein [Extibacter sp. GGCC_0201]MBO1721913.1 hypothetical protein [Extibacter sp. GGCC_0201]BDF32902.1 hypothetical protein CE91St61_09770 [Lachnospiraceae bacterium]BDF36907.1 hypothetical protein CE91St62_09680 [Lachnospiraceae bacterium]
MKRNIKKIIVGTSLAAVFLAGCQKKVECDICGKKAVCQTKTVLGKEMELCDKCVTDIEKIENGDILNDFINGLANEEDMDEAEEYETEEYETVESEEVTFSDLTYDSTNGTISGKMKNNTDYFIDSVEVVGTLERHETNGYGEDETHEERFSKSYGICHVGKGEEKDFSFNIDLDQDEVSKYSTPQINTDTTVITYRGKENDDFALTTYLAQDNEYEAEVTKNGDGFIEEVTIKNTSDYQWECLNVYVERHIKYYDTLETEVMSKTQIDKGATVTFTSDDMKNSGIREDGTQILYVTFEPRNP